MKLIGFDTKKNIIANNFSISVEGIEYMFAFLFGS